ncbi:MAG: CBS domain-containing protein, partial [Alphaproteobacteria bacterium]|nr:CBS domain-containing protein [Alphaproteobacteria bacterium]
MRAADIMTGKVVAVGPETPVSEAARLMLEHRVSGLPVIDLQGKVIGIVSDGDLMRRAEGGTERHRPWWLEMVASNAERARDFEKARGRHVR